MTERKLGRLREVPLREIWGHEQYDFSDWLSQEENLSLLGDEIGLTLVEPETEKFVGSYRCDIVAKDETSGLTVLIENQLEPTNHDHLGKLITYASGLKAAVVVWIVEYAREEHASAIEWLNEHTDDSVSFFLIEIHAMKIGDSDPAPQFKVIERPNDFNKEAKKATKDDSERESYARRIEFWTRLNEILEQRKYPFNRRKATTSASYDFAIGTSVCHLCMTLVNKDGFIRVLMWIPDSKEQFDLFHEHKDEIEGTIGHELDWDRMEGKKASWISLHIQGLDFNNRDNYDELINECLDWLIKMRKAFKPYFLK